MSAAAGGSERGNNVADIDAGHLVGAAALLVAGGLVYAAMHKSGGVPVPGTTEDATGEPTPMAPILLSEQHVSPVMYTAHRYPRMCGQEITTLIHRGHTAATVPLGDPEALWIIKPPSEVVL